MLIQYPLLHIINKSLFQAWICGFAGRAVSFSDFANIHLTYFSTISALDVKDNVTPCIHQTTDD